MLNARQAGFRKEYRSRIVGWYNGYFHILVIYAMGAAAYYYYVPHIQGVLWWEWLTIPTVFLLSNILNGPCIATSCIARSTFVGCGPYTIGTP